MLGRSLMGPVVDFFVLGSQSKREDSDLKSLQDAMKKANEMDAVFLEDIKTAAQKFKQVIAKSMWYDIYCCLIRVQLNLYITDKLVQVVLSVIRRCPYWEVSS